MLLESMSKRLDVDENFNRALMTVDPVVLFEHVHVAGAALAVIEERSRAATPSQARCVWLRSMRAVYLEMDRSGFSQYVANLGAEVLGTQELDVEVFVDHETDIVVKHFPESRLNRDDVSRVVHYAHEFLGGFKERVNARLSFTAREVFDSHESPGVKEAGAYLGAVNLAGAVAPEPFVSKGIAVASVVTGFIAQWF